MAVPECLRTKGRALLRRLTCEVCVKDSQTAAPATTTASVATAASREGICASGAAA